MAWRAITAESEGLAPENGRENGSLRDDKDDKGEPER